MLKCSLGPVHPSWPGAVVAQRGLFGSSAAFEFAIWWTPLYPKYREAYGA